MKDYNKYILSNTSTIRDALIALNNLSDDALTLFVLDKKERMIGSLTDGDIRRKLVDGCELSESVTKAMHTTFHYVNYSNINVLSIKKLKETNIVLLPCLDEDMHILKIFNLKKFNSILPIDAVIMAGGKGERLRPLTDKIPKPLLKVGEKSIIDYNVDRLISFGIVNISITVNYLKEQIENHFIHERDGIKVNCVREPQYFGTIGSVKYVDSFQNDCVLIMNSDLFTNIDLESFYLNFIENSADMSVAAVPYSVNIPFGIFEISENAIKGVKEKPTYNYYANAGIYLIRKVLLDLIPDNKFFNATDFMELLISKKYKVVRFPLTGYWIDIGKNEDYLKAQELVKHL